LGTESTRRETARHLFKTGLYYFEARLLFQDLRYPCFASLNFRQQVPNVIRSGIRRRKRTCSHILPQASCDKCR